MNYKNAISCFEKFIEEIYSHKNSNSNGIELKGYLINYKYYEKIKEVINNYEKNKNDFDSGKNIKINQIEFKTPQYLINMILNGNKYIFINTELWELFCDKDKKDESPIICKVNKKNITFILDNIELSFRHNKNIIDKNTLNYNYSYVSNYNKIKQIFKSVIKYYNFENKFMQNLKNKQDSNDNNTYGYLVSKSWIDKWKILSNYEDIKTDYLQNNSNKKNFIVKKIKLTIVNYLVQ